MLMVFGLSKLKNGGNFPVGKPGVAKKPLRVLVEKTIKIRRGPNKGKEKKVQKLVPRTPRTFVNQPDAVRSKHLRRSLRAPKIRRSIVPGRVCIVLEGKFRGKRVVIVKSLQSGLVVVTGPASLNSVPLRRMSPAYLIATSVKFDFKAVTAALQKDQQNLAAVDDKFFEKERSKHLKLARKQLTADEHKARIEKKLAKRKADNEKKDGKKLKIILKKPRTSVVTKGTRRVGTVKKLKELTDKQKQRKALQKALDHVLLKEAKKTPLLEGYLRSQFELKAGQYPHELKF